jgi:hypothetical protein
MSYEGYAQILCEKSHLHEEDAYSNFTDWSCAAVQADGKLCGAKIHKTNNVDDTKGESYGYCKPIKLTDTKVETCNMGHQHVIEEATYTLSETRYYFDGGADWIAIEEENTLS